MKTPAPEQLDMVRKLCAGMSYDDMCVYLASIMAGKEEAEEKYLKAENARIDAENIIIEKNKIISGMRKEYLDLESRYKTVKDENKELKKQCEHLDEVFKKAQHRTFGVQSEKLDNLIDASPAKEIIDEDEVEDTGDNEDSKQAANANSLSGSSSKGKRGGKGRKPVDYSKLKVVDVYDVDLEALRKQYGDNLTIISWNSTTTLVYVPAYVYVLVKHRPTIAYGSGNERKLLTMPSEPDLWQKSPVSPSLLARIIYEKFDLCLTFCRIEREFADSGIPLTRQTMDRWVIRAGMEIFKPVCEYFKKILQSLPYNQCDETTIQVNNDGRKPGSKSFYWVHSSGELYSQNPVVLFCYEPTRGTDHLREFYENFEGCLTCDAYISYLLLESENLNVIFVCGCMMHMRRRFANALLIAKHGNLPEEKVKELPAYKALEFIKAIYAADEGLKKLSAKKRKKRRNKEVRPIVNDFYAYIESLDTNDPMMGETLKDAILYAINQKEHLTRFLDDGYIPIDNGFVERSIRLYTILRRNALFCTSIEGAEVTGYLCSIVATAIANKAQTGCYVQYLLENVPQHLDPWGKYDDSFMKTMMPWSKEYQAYEKQYSPWPGGLPDVPLGPHQYREPPKMPERPKSETPAATCKPPSAA